MYKQEVLASWLYSITSKWIVNDPGVTVLRFRFRVEVFNPESNSRISLFIFIIIIERYYQWMAIRRTLRHLVGMIPMGGVIVLVLIIQTAISIDLRTDQQQRHREDRQTNLISYCNLTLTTATVKLSKNFRSNNMPSTIDLPSVIFFGKWNLLKNKKAWQFASLQFKNNFGESEIKSFHHLNTLLVEFFFKKIETNMPNHFNLIHELKFNHFWSERNWRKKIWWCLINMKGVTV